MAGKEPSKGGDKQAVAMQAKTLPLPQALAIYYREKVKPAEDQLPPEVYMRHPLMDGQITSKPSVLFVGEYSTGKTTLINHILQTPYVGSQVAIGPTTENFFILMHSEENDIIPASKVVQGKALPHAGSLSGLKPAILERCFIVLCRSALLRHLIIIDSPGIVTTLDDKARRKDFDYIDTIVRFAQSSDATVFLFDANKMNVGNADVVHTLRLLSPVEDRLAFIVNKADELPLGLLNDIRGNLAWSLSRMMKRETVPSIFVGSFWDRPLRRPDSCRFFQQYIRAFYDYLRNIAENVHRRRLEEIADRARQVRGLALTLNHIAKEAPKLTRKNRKKVRRKLRTIYPRLIKRNKLRIEDLPPVEKINDLLRQTSLTAVPTVSSDALGKVEEFVDRDLIKLAAALPWRLHVRASSKSTEKGEVDFDWAAVVSEAERNDWKNEFTYLYPSYNHLDACQLRPIMIKSGVPDKMQNKIWNLVDEDKDKLINENEFYLLRYLLGRASKGKGIPDSLPKNCRPPLMKFKESKKRDEESESEDKKERKRKRSKSGKKKKSRKKRSKRKKKSSHRVTDKE